MSSHFQLSAKAFAPHDAGREAQSDPAKNQTSSTLPAPNPAASFAEILPPITDYSFGVIALRLSPSLPTGTKLSKSTADVLLIHQKTSSPKLPSFWCFPKGHPEFGDNNVLHTAIRELKEETGVEVSMEDILHFYVTGSEENKKEVEFKERYTNPIRRKGKQVRFWVAFVKSERAKMKIKVQEREVVEAGWYSWGEANRKLTFEETRGVLNSVGEFLDTKNWNK